MTPTLRSVLRMAAIVLLCCASLASAIAWIASAYGHWSEWYFLVDENDPTATGYLLQVQDGVVSIDWCTHRLYQSDKRDDWCIRWPGCRIEYSGSYMPPNIQATCRPPSYWIGV